MVASFLLTVLALLSLASGCDLDPYKEEQDHINRMALQTRWQLEAFINEDATTITVDDPERYIVRLYYDTAKLRSDCNSCEGRYLVDGSSFNFIGLTCTEVSCGPQSFDPQFRAAVSTVFAWEIRPSGPLFLVYDGGKMRLTKAPSGD
jgi:heat shock protein HslJ